MNLNHVIIVGRLTRDPELKSTPSGQSVCPLSIATNRTWTDKEGKRNEETEFHSVVTWGKQAEVAAQFLKKGSSVLIEGRLKTRSYMDKQGVERKITEIITESMSLGPNEEKKPLGHVRPEDTPEII